MSLDKVIVALDFSDRKKAIKIVNEIDELISFYKVGFELFISEGEKILRLLKKRQKRIFLDLKFHDIPNTVKKAVKASLNFGVDMLTLHTTGGLEMMKKAREVIEEEKIKNRVEVKLLGVTILTSLDNYALREIYSIDIEVSATVMRLSKLAKIAGLDGVIASAHEASLIKQHCGEDFLVVTPGIRLENTPQDDQKRTVTPAEAFYKGADYIVIGRAITQSKNPREILKKIFNQNSVHSELKGG